MTRRLNDPPAMNLPPAAATTGGTSKAKGKARDRFAVVNTFLDFAAAGLSRADVLVWMLLWRDTKPDGTARTAIADLARRAGLNRGTVLRAKARLAEAGLLTVVYRGSVRRGPSAYRVHPLPKTTEPPKR